MATHSLAIGFGVAAVGVALLLPASDRPSSGRLDHAYRPSAAGASADGSTTRAEAFAQNLHISRAEASARLSREPDITELQTSARQLFGSQYSGLWVDHAEGGTVFVAATKLDPAVVEKLRASFPYPEILQFVETAETVAGLEAIQSQLTQEQASLPSFSTDIDYSLNAVVLFPSKELNAEQTGSLRRQYGDALLVGSTGTAVSMSMPAKNAAVPMSVGPLTACDRFDCAPPLRGGIAIKRDGSGNRYDCTSGFSARPG